MLTKYLNTIVIKDNRLSIYVAKRHGQTNSICHEREEKNHVVFSSYPTRGNEMFNGASTQNRTENAELQIRSYTI